MRSKFDRAVIAPVLATLANADPSLMLHVAVVEALHDESLGDALAVTAFPTLLHVHVHFSFHHLPFHSFIRLVVIRMAVKCRDSRVPFTQMEQR